MKEDLGRLREISQQGPFQQGLHLLPIINRANDRSMDLFHEIMINDENGEQNFKQIVEEFIRLIENKVVDTEFKIFDAKYVMVFFTR